MFLTEYADDGDLIIQQAFISVICVSEQYDPDMLNDLPQSERNDQRDPRDLTPIVLSVGGCAGIVFEISKN